MPTFTVYWHGTVYGSCEIEAENEAEARKIAEYGEGGGWDGAIDIHDYPDNWSLDEPDAFYQQDTD